MAVEYEDNYGFWKIDEPWERAFFERRTPSRCLPNESSSL